MYRLTAKILLLLLIVAVIDRVGDRYLKSGLESFFYLNGKYDVLCIGHSHTEQGIDEKLLEQGLAGLRVGKYAMKGVNTFDRQAMIRQAFARNSSISLVIYDVDINTFNTKGVGSSSYKLLYPFLGDPAIDGYLKGMSDPEEYYSRKYLHLLRYPSIMQKYAFKQLLNSKDPTEVFNLDVQQLRTSLARGSHYSFAVDAANRAAFRETIALIRARNARVILLFIPTVDIINSINRSDYRKMIALFQEEAARDQGVTFLNYSDRYEGNHDFFRDPTHLNNKGRAVVTRDLAGDVARIMSRAQ
jgi:hypothetical protein